MRTALDQESCRQLEFLLKKGVLTPFEPASKPIKGFTIWMACPDGANFSWRFQTLKSFLQSDLIHPVTRNGGALRLLPESPTNHPGRTTADDLVDELLESTLIKSTNRLLIETHGKCGKGSSVKIDLKHSIAHLSAGRKRLLTMYPQLQITCLCHIDRGPGEKMQYYQANLDAYRRLTRD